MTQNAIATLPNVDELEAGRDRALALFMEARDKAHACFEEAARASVGGSIHFDADLLELFMATKPRIKWDAAKRDEVPPRDAFAAAIATAIDRRCWSYLYDATGAADIMDKQAKQEWRDSMADPAPFTADNCRATFGHLWGNRREIYLRGIANIFRGLDRRFRSHDAFGWGSRIILSGALNESGWWHNYDARDALDDAERTMFELDGQTQPQIGHVRDKELEQMYRRGEGLPDYTEVPMQRAVSHALRTEQTPFVVEGRYMRVRVFKNGNLHIWFTRKDLLSQVNKLLLEYFRPVEGDVDTDAAPHNAGPLYHQTPAKNFGFFPTPESLCTLLERRNIFRPGLRVLEPSAGTGNLAQLAVDAGCRVSCIEIQPALCAEMVARFNGKADVRTGDFLTITPPVIEQYDVIIMNPPFDKGRDADHVRHAWQFLKPGGRLVAIMSAGAEFRQTERYKALHAIVERASAPWGNRKWFDLPERSFAPATNVDTVLLDIRKPS